jgi:hypothetical protein
VEGINKRRPLAKARVEHNPLLVMASIEAIVKHNAFAKK